MSWLQKLLPPRIKSTPGVKKTAVPEGLWIKCPACEAVLYRTDLENNLFVCPKCSIHSACRRASASSSCSTRKGRFEIGSEVVPIDSLKFKDQKKYPERLVGGARGDGRDRRARRDAGKRQERAARARVLRVRFHGRLDGLGGRRALRARRARRVREPRPVRLHLGVGRRADAGRRATRSSRWRRRPPCCRSSPRRGCRSCRS